MWLRKIWPGDSGAAATASVASSVVSMAAPDAAAGPAPPKKAPMSSLMAVVDNGYAFLKKKIILYRLNSYF